MDFYAKLISGRRKGQFCKKNVLMKQIKLIEKNKSRPSRVPTSKVMDTDQNDSNQDCEQTDNHILVNRFEGRRIVELDKLAQDLWCKPCNEPLSLRHKKAEQRIGLVSKIIIQCQKCSGLIDVYTNTKVGSHYYAANMKLAIGMLDAGLGEVRLNTLLTAMNIPPIPNSTLKRHEKIVGSGIRQVAEKSCIDAIKLEKELTLKFNSKKNHPNEQDMNNNVDLSAAIDGAWTKPGRQHNSLTGHSSMFGVFSKKVMGYRCKAKKCRTPDDKEHVCMKNHEGSSKAMEADMAVELVLKNNHLVNAKCRVTTIVLDEDGAVSAALARLSPYAIVTWSDFNHVKKNFNSKLYEIKITANLREYFSKMFSHAVKQNKGNPIRLKVALESIVPHAYGDHSKCGSWCKKEDQYTYKYFKNKEPLADDSLKEKLIKIMSHYVNKAEQIAPCGSTQANESFNFLVCTKHPKSAYYGGSESHYDRVSLAVCQKNLGYEYILEVNTKLELSPGHHTHQYRKRKQQIADEQMKKKQTIPKKRRRLELKNERNNKNISCERREGICYESGSGFLDTSDLIDESVIPAFVDYEMCVVVIFDTETTGLHKDDEIVQIAAICNENVFETYILPRKKYINEKASEKTGLKIINGELYSYEEKVTTVSPREGFLKFLYFLKRQQSPCILVAHNGFRFDVPRLLKLAEEVALLKEMESFIKGFADSYLLLKKQLPERVKEKKSFSQLELAQDYLQQSEILVAHNAINDVIMLDKLLKKLDISKDVIIQFTENFDFQKKQKDIRENLKKKKDSMGNLQISNYMKARIAKAGLNMEALKEACNYEDESKLRILLAVSVNKKPRVTNKMSIIKNIYEQLKS